MNENSERFWRGIDFGIDLIMLPFRAMFWFVAVTLRTIFGLKQ